VRDRLAAFEAPAVVPVFDDVATMGQAIEQRGSHLGLSERQTTEPVLLRITNPMFLAS
jgi:hypothetical protein